MIVAANVGGGIFGRDTIAAVKPFMILNDFSPHKIITLFTIFSIHNNDATSYNIFSGVGRRFSRGGLQVQCFVVCWY